MKNVETIFELDSMKKKKIQKMIDWTKLLLWSPNKCVKNNFFWSNIVRGHP